MFVVYLKRSGNNPSSSADTKVEQSAEKSSDVGREAYDDIHYYLGCVGHTLRRDAERAEALKYPSSHVKRLRQQAKTLMNARKPSVFFNLTADELEALAEQALEWDPCAVAVEIGR